MTSPVVKDDQEEPIDELDADEHPGDDEDGRTIASVPEFEIPKDMPSPLGSVPPPPMTPPRASPASQPKPPPISQPKPAQPQTRPAFPPRPTPGPGATGRLPPASARQPVPPPMPDPQADNPTMHAGQSLDTFMPKEEQKSSRGIRTAPVQLPPLETTGLLEDAPRNDDETTKSVSRDDLFGSAQMRALQQQVRDRDLQQVTEQQQQVVVGEDDGAMGEDATLAVGPGQLGDFRPPSARSPGFENVNVTESSNIGGIGAALAETLAGPPSAQQPPNSQTQQSPYAPPPPTFQQPPPPGSWPQTPVQQGAFPHSPQPPSHHGPGPSPWSATQQAPVSLQGQPMAVQRPAPPLPPTSPAPAGPAAAPARPPIPTQLIVLGIVGVVCLAIFVTGIWLFVTTKF